jgi:hypothetical protein
LIFGLPALRADCKLPHVLTPRRLLVLACTLGLLTGTLGTAGFAAAGSPQIDAESSKRKKKRCPKGYKLKKVTIKRHGKKIRVKRCRKVRKRVPQPGAAGPLFEPPGRKLEGQEAVPFLERYLLNSTFTDCPAGWPNCAVEERYSHTSEGSFFYCRLTSTSGSDIINGARAYQVQNAVVEADGSWTFNEVVDNYGSPSYYEWHVAVNGVVTGAYQFNEIQQLGPLQYVSGARDCNY